jgi:hypothetical protein
MTKWYTVIWKDGSIWGQYCSHTKDCDTEEEANALIEILKTKEGVTKIYKVTKIYETITEKIQ